jgi:hypothetical protein
MRTIHGDAEQEGRTHDGHCEDACHHLTLSGTGSVLSRAVYQGIRMKKRK